MAHYKVIDELESFDFHDAYFRSVVFDGNTMIWKIKDAIVIGRSRLEIPDLKPCSCNTGEDRYAEPILQLTFKNYAIKSIRRGGGYSVKDGIRTEIPVEYLDNKSFQSCLLEVVDSKKNTINYMGIDKDDGCIGLALLGGREYDFYIMQFTAAHVVAEWEAFGKEAWYLERYRQRHQRPSQ